MSDPWSAEKVLLRREIRAMREAAGLTQLELSTSLDKPQSYVSKIESGRPLHQLVGSACAMHGLWRRLHRLRASLGCQTHLARITSKLYTQVKDAFIVRGSPKHPGASKFLIRVPRVGYWGNRQTTATRILRLAPDTGVRLRIIGSQGFQLFAHPFV